MHLTVHYNSLAVQIMMLGTYANNIVSTDSSLCQQLT